jgi:predicted secreted hydrolase
MKVAWGILIQASVLLFDGREVGFSEVLPSSPVPFEPATAGYAYVFPRDHGSHDRFRTEWWYYTGHLTAGDGRRFGYQLTFFRRGVDNEAVRTNPSQWAIRQLYLAHAAISDLRQGRFRYAEKISRAGLGKAGAETGQLRVWIDRWITEAARPEHPQQHLKASTDDFSLDLMVTPEKPPIVHGEQGISRKGSAFGQASHYYSLTRLATSGTVATDGKTFTVTGTSWMDHEFGSGDLGNEMMGWDWFSVQLDNRTELMLYHLRRADGHPDPVSGGTLIFPDGRAHHLAHADFQVDTLDRWTSRASGARYPSRWRISIPSHGLTLELKPLLADQELITKRSTQVTYWEGTVQAVGTLQNASVAGQGYVELTGYAERFRQKF